MRKSAWIVAVMLMLGGGAAWAHQEPEHQAGAGPQTLTGEVVDVTCYLSHGKEGLGAGHAGCAKHCIESGLPAAIKAGDQLYLAVMADHSPANKTLAEFAAQQVTVTGTVMERDGQHLIAITKVEKAK